MATHNLNIQNYSFDEILGLFDFKSYDITLSDMKRAKHRVLMLHPDKSRLSAEYFLFYKKAYEVILEFYKHQARQSQEINEKTTVYQPEVEPDHSKRMQKQITKTIEQMPAGDFQNKFNELFEQNGFGHRPDPRRNDWFAQDGTSVTIPQKNVTANNLGETFQAIKQQNSGMVRYQGVQDLYLSGSGATKLYDDDEDDYKSGGYVHSDPFGKLKFDDLRKVHKDQTVFAVNETDFQHMPQYNTVEQYRQEQNKHSYDPMSDSAAKQMLDQREREMRDKMMRKEYEAKLQSQQFQEKNKTVLAKFLQLR